MDVGQQSGNLRDSRPRRPPPKRASERHEQTQVRRARTERFRMWSIVESTQKKDPPKGLWTSVGGGEKFTGACARAHRAIGKRFRKAAFLGESLLDRRGLRPFSNRYGPTKGRQLKRFRTHRGDRKSTRLDSSHGYLSDAGF